MNLMEKGTCMLFSLFTTYVVVNKEKSMQVPDPEYFKIIENGGKEHGLPQEYFDHLKQASVTECNPVGIRMNDTSGMVILEGGE